MLVILVFEFYQGLFNLSIKRDKCFYTPSYLKIQLNAYIYHIIQSETKSVAGQSRMHVYMCFAKKGGDFEEDFNACPWVDVIFLVCTQKIQIQIMCATF